MNDTKAVTKQTLNYNNRVKTCQQNVMKRCCIKKEENDIHNNILKHTDPTMGNGQCWQSNRVSFAGAYKLNQKGSVWLNIQSIREKSESQSVLG